MAHKKGSWERSNKQLLFSLILILSTSPFLISAMEMDEFSKDTKSDSEEVDIQILPNDDDDDISDSLPISNHNKMLIEDRDLDEIDEVWKKAPETIKNWALELKDRRYTYASLPYRLVLYGKPGIGKTDLALGIWKQNSDWERKCISAGDLITKHRGGAAKKLRKHFNTIDKKVKTFLIIDEAHVLMERFSQESTDTSETTEVLKSFLDKHAENPNIMIVLTANYVNDMKPSMQSRLFEFGVEIKPPTTKELCEIFHYYADREGLSHESLPNTDLTELFKSADIQVPREVKYLACSIKKFIRNNGYHGPLKEYVLSKSVLLGMTQHFLKKKKDFGVGKEKLSDREFQQKLHNDAKCHQNKLTAASLLGSAAISAAGYAASGKHKSKKSSNEAFNGQYCSNQGTKSTSSLLGSFFGSGFSAAGSTSAAVTGKAAATKGGLIALKAAVVANPLLTAGIVGGIIVIAGIGGVVYCLISDDKKNDDTKKKQNK
jgi:hypothetical protein